MYVSITHVRAPRSSRWSRHEAGLTGIRQCVTCRFGAQGAGRWKQRQTLVGQQIDPDHASAHGLGEVLRNILRRGGCGEEIELVRRRAHTWS